jgi:RNA polymerase primary sigma factor
LELGDLISAGNLGLIQAAKKFDISIGAKFSSYGGYWIRMEIMKLLNTHMENIKIPIHKQKEGFKIHVERIFQDIEFTSEVEEQDDSYEERIAQVMNALNKLPLKQQKVIKEYFGIGCDRKSLVNIGIENAQMKQAVWDTKDRALKNLKGQLGNRTFHN